MKIVALLSWYEEPASWLAATVASLTGVAQHLIAVDGAYAAFPGALSRPSSGPEQAEAIIETASAAHIGVTVHRPEGPWLGGEVEKRDFMFQAAMLMADDGDWVMPIDADERVTKAPPDLLRILEGTDALVGSVLYWERSPGSGTDDRLDHRPLEFGSHGHRQLYRALPGLRVEYAHFCYLAGPHDAPVWLWGPEGAPLEDAFEIPGMEIEHRHGFRKPARWTAQAEYYDMRDRARLEDTPAFAVAV